MALLDDKVAALAEVAGWKHPRREEDGAYRFHLENDLNVAFFSPDERRCIMRAVIASVPEDEAQRDALLRSTAARQAGICQTRASIVALEKPGQSLLGESAAGEQLILYRMLDLDAAQQVFVDTARDFLNDLAWWKASFGEGTGRSGPDFAFSMQNGFWGGFR
ncbi:MAG TPA: type III secretion system chaperone [Candidatus Avidesulfovibrio excrementigallinarum]|nr:type III secretion system chaperone [Candidatus Avidesulfovibrio excrementigallinarum]